MSVRDPARGRLVRSPSRSYGYGAGMGGQYHLDAETYLVMIRSEIDHYDDLQAALADATAEASARTILDLGSGTGETALAVLRRHPGATLVGIDSSENMLSVARQQLPSATFIVSRLEDPLPAGDFDLVVSAFAVHHLDAGQKASLFRRVANVLAPGGRFAILDVVVPTELVSKPIPLEEGVDVPSSVVDMVQWLDAAGLQPEIVYSAGDLAILAATAPEHSSNDSLAARRQPLPGQGPERTHNSARGRADS